MPKLYGCMVQKHLCIIKILEVTCFWVENTNSLLSIFMCKIKIFILLKNYNCQFIYVVLHQLHVIS